MEGGGEGWIVVGSRKRGGMRIKINIMIKMLMIWLGSMDVGAGWPRKGAKEGRN